MRERRKERRIVAFVMAGGEGKRLWPLTAKRCKPAVPFGGRYRLIDFVLSNLINSQITSIYLLVQYKAQSLIEHIRKAWTISPLLPDQFVTVVPPQMHAESQRFEGTADAVYQSLNLLSLHRPDIVAVFSSDHVYRMDIRQMLRFHYTMRADATVAALPVRIDQVSSFGIIEADSSGQVRSFQEKPEHAASIPGNRHFAYASMGNYLFNTNVLIEALENAHKRGETDFGYQVLPRLARDRRVFAYNFNDNQVPGLKSYEQANYWRDVGDLDTYFESHKDVLGIEPLFDAFNPQWPIFSSHYQGPVARVCDSDVDNCLLGAAVVVNNASIKNSILRREVMIEPDVELEECIIMDYVRVCKGSKLRRVIVDRYNIIRSNTIIGFNPRDDKQRYYVSDAGVVVVPKGKPDYYARDSRGGRPGYRE